MSQGVPRCLHGYRSTRVAVHSRAFSTSVVLSRAPQTSYPSSSLPKNTYTRSQLPPSFGPPGGRTPQRRPKTFRPSGPSSPSSITSAAVLTKLEQHLKSSWLGGAGPLEALASSLGVSFARIQQLSKAFGTEALAELKSRREGGGGGRAYAIDWNVEDLRMKYVAEGPSCLSPALIRAFILWTATIPRPPASSPADPTLSKLQHLQKLTDFTYPGEEFPAARQLRRKLILHVGPTNSGKTHSALVALARAKTGVYAGPLRLLAHEVFSRFNEGKIGDEGKRVCNLITGEEQRILDPNAALSSCTVEMFPLSRRLAVGVIDEIQMIGDSQRGSAWTAAVLGAQCDELHLCGEESVVELVEGIAMELGDDIEIKRYQRLSPLVIAKDSLEGDLSKIRRGDCLVTFSRNNIFAFKRVVEEKTGLRVAVAYGGLPPEVREEQARAFNEGDYDVLVASDAIGMGLNLCVYSLLRRRAIADRWYVYRKIKRIVFETLHKWDGRAEVQLPLPQIKQIAGRAGRFGLHKSPSGPDDATPSTASPSPGEVTTLDEADLPLLRQAMAAGVVQVPQAVMGPPQAAIADVCTLLPPSVRFSQLLSLVDALAQSSTLYVHAPSTGSSAVVDAIEHVKLLTFSERLLFGNSPVNMRDLKVQAAIVSFVEAYSVGRRITMKEWGTESGLYAALERVMDVRRQTPAGSASPSTPKSAAIFNSIALAILESFHRCLTLYLWLSYRLPDSFCDAETARPLRKEFESAIDFTLAGMKFERIGRLDKMKKRAAEGEMGLPSSEQSSRGDRRS